MMMRLEFWGLADDGTWGPNSNGVVLTADNVKAAWHFIRHCLAPYAGHTSIFHIRDGQRAALTSARFEKILRDFGSGRPVAFGSVENPKLIALVEIPT